MCCCNAIHRGAADCRRQPAWRPTATTHQGNPSGKLQWSYLKMCWCNAIHWGAADCRRQPAWRPTATTHQGNPTGIQWNYLKMCWSYLKVCWCRALNFHWLPEKQTPRIGATWRKWPTVGRKRCREEAFLTFWHATCQRRWLTLQAIVSHTQNHFHQTAPTGEPGVRWDLHYSDSMWNMRPNLGGQAIGEMWNIRLKLRKPGHPQERSAL